MRVHFQHLVLLAAVAFAGGKHAAAADGPTTAPASQLLLSGMDHFKPGGQSAAAMARFTESAVTGRDFDRAVSVQINGSPANRWDVALQAPVAAELKKNDVLLVRFWAKTTDALMADGLVGVAVELNRDPWEKLAEGQFSVPREWTRIDLPLTVKHDFDANSVNVNLRLGYAGQTLEVAGVELQRMVPGTLLESLPRTVATYRGMEDDAPWRKAAFERIETLRKADLTVVVKDAAGRPVPDQLVTIALKKHAFHFGTAVDATLILDPGDSARRYREHLTAAFNTVVYENDLKWPTLSRDPGRFSVVDQTLAWFAERDIQVRGHVLVWPSFKRMPAEIGKLKDDPAALKAAVDEHVTSMVTKYRGRLPEWDVVNEPFTNRDLEKILGRDAFIDWFKLARAADPQAKLFINDYGIIETGNRLNTDHQKYYEDFIQYLLAHDAPIDAIGIQGHFGSAVTDPQNMLDTLDRFAKFGKPIRITELDLNMLDPELQATFLRDVFIVCFSHPAVDGVMQWGFWEGRHWLPDAALYSRDWTLREHGQAWAALMASWTTNVTVRTGPQGEAIVRGFLGKYDVGVGGKTQQVDLPKAGRHVELVVER